MYYPDDLNEAAVKLYIFSLGLFLHAKQSTSLHSKSYQAIVTLHRISWTHILSTSLCCKRQLDNTQTPLSLMAMQLFA